MMNSIKIIIPVYNDWEAVQLLIMRMHQVLNEHLINRISILIVNDCSTIEKKEINSARIPVELLHLRLNMGHQRAIAIGLSYLNNDKNCDKVIIMDADGEDKPEDIETLLNNSEKNGMTIIFGKRAKRSEGLVFVLFYKIYKLFFSVLTGKTIEFGNFCLIPCEQVGKLVYVTEIWNHFSGGIIRSKLPYKSVPLKRGKRLAGATKMNFTSLIVHGLSAVSVHIDTVAIRLLIASLVLIVFSLSGLGIVVFIRFNTSLAIPGWATNLAAALFIVLLQAFIISLFLSFMVLTYRTQKHFIPAIDYKDFVLRLEKMERI